MNNDITNMKIDVILLDDEKDEFIRDFRQSAKMQRVNIKEQFSDAKSGINYIKEHHDEFDAIILDGLFFEDKSSSNKQDINALKSTVDVLNKMLYKENIRIPFCVLTGNLKKEDDSILSNVKVYYKGSDNRKLFNYLKSEVAKIEEYQIKTEYEEVFELFDLNLLPKDKEDDLLKILGKLRSKAKYNKDDAFNPIRKFYEVLVRCLYEEAYEKNKFQDIVHDDLFDWEEKLNITGSYYYLSGFPVKQGSDVIIKKRNESVWPVHIKSLADMLIQITHTNSHDYPENVHHYTYKSVVNALLELLLWYKEFISSYK